MWPWLVALAGGLGGLALLVVLLMREARRAGELTERAATRDDMLDAVEGRNEAERAVRGLGDGTAADQLRDHWSRD